MCDPVSLALLAGALTAKTVNTRQTNRRKDRELAAGIRKQGEIGQESADAVNKEIQSLAESNPEREKAEAIAGFQATLRENQDLTSEAQGGDIFGANERFAEDVSGSLAGVSARAGGRAGLLSKIDAPGRQRTREAVGRGQLAADVRGFADRSEMEDFLARLKASEQRNNPLIDIGADILSGVATGGLTSGTNLTGLFGDKIANLGFLGAP